MPALGYLGLHRGDNSCEVVAIDSYDRPSRPLPLRRDLIDYSSEFSWGYAPDGGAWQLALAILADHLGQADAAAVRLHREFERRVVGELTGRIWSLTNEDIQAWLATVRRQYPLPVSAAAQ